MTTSRFDLPGLDGISQQTVLTKIRRKVNPELNLPLLLNTAIDGDLVAELIRKFPNVCPDAGFSVEEIYRKQGEQRVLSFLVQAFYQQNPEVK